MSIGKELAVTGDNPAELYRVATDVAGVCKEIVLQSSVKIGDRNYVLVEGWMAIATAHGCMASCKLVEKVVGGYRAVAEIRRMRDGAVLCEAEGFVGEDETLWFGGEREVWNKWRKLYEKKTLPKREDFAIRAMAQTRAVSRACRTAFAHVVVMMKANLSTTPAEEVVDPEAGNDATQREEPKPTNAPDPKKETLPGDAPDQPAPAAPAAETPQAKPIEVPRDGGNITEAERAVFKEGKWRQVVVHFGTHKNEKLGTIEDGYLTWLATEWEPKPYGTAKTISPQDRSLRAALDAFCEEEGVRAKKRH